VIFILADDLGYGDLGCYGQSQIATPNIDRIASEGVRFTQAYAGSTVCAPSRCALMTGLHTGHARIRGNKRISLLPEDFTVARLFQQAGYKTGIFGKWGLGDAGQPGIPNLKGFDEWFGYLDQTHAHDYFTGHLWDNQSETLFPENWGNRRKTYSHDLFTKRDLSFIERHRNEPFFLYAAFTIPHANNEAVGYAPHGMEVPSDAPYSDKPWPPQERSFAAMVHRLDQSVGQIMAALKTASLDENTLVIFTSDNGPHQEGKHDPKFFHSSGPLRGIKRDLYEGGIRVPFLARWPGKIHSGGTSDAQIAFWDFLPTMAELTGVAAPAVLDGISFLPALLDKPQRAHEYLYWEFHERGFQQAVRQGDWKAVRLKRGAIPELYNLKNDLGETRNLAGDNPSRAEELGRLMDRGHVDSPDWPVS
jgi:arylsulfatase A-like enzyme